MRTRGDDIPVVMDALGATARHLPDFGTAVGTLAAEHYRLEAGVDVSPLLEGLEDDHCQAPHWGYIVSGKVTVTYTGGDQETCVAGDVVHWPAGHTVRGRRHGDGPLQPTGRPPGGHGAHGSAPGGPDRLGGPHGDGVWSALGPRRSIRPHRGRSTTKGFVSAESAEPEEGGRVRDSDILRPVSRGSGGSGSCRRRGTRWNPTPRCRPSPSRRERSRSRRTSS